MTTFSILVSALLAASVPSGVSSDLSCPVPGHGAFVMTVPANWRTWCKSLASPASTNARATPLSGDDFRLMITAVWLHSLEKSSPDDQSMRANVESVGKQSLPDAVETSVNVVEIKSPSMSGFVFSLTSKRPEPPGYKYMMQGEMRVGELTVAVTFLFRNSSGKDKAAAIRALKTARHLK